MLQTWGRMAFYAAWACWLFCCAFPMWHDRWMRRRWLLFYVGMMGPWALFYGWMALTHGAEAVSLPCVLIVACAQALVAGLMLKLAHRCYALLIAPLESKRGAACTAVRVRRVLDVLVCTGLAAFVLPPSSQVYVLWTLQQAFG